MTRTCAVAFAVLLCISSHAHAQLKRIATYDFWAVFASDNRNECSVRAFPDIPSPLSGGLLLSVTPTRTMTTIQVKARDFDFHPQLKTVFAFEDKIINLSTINRTGFVNYSNPENELLVRFRTRSEAILWSMTTSGTMLKDTFFLKGFSQALDRAEQECGLAPPPVQTSQTSSTASAGHLFGPDNSYLTFAFIIFIIGGVILALAVTIGSNAKNHNESYSSGLGTLAREPVEQPIQSTEIAIRPQPVSPQAFAESGPVKGIQLRLKRGKRPGALGKVIFTLDARIDVSAESRSLIENYKLGNRVIYESANREKYRAKALQNVENTREQPGLFASPGAQAWGLAKTLGRVGAAAVNATVAALSLRITVNSLMQGHHVESNDMGEILEAENALREAKENLEATLETAQSFDGREEVV